MKKNYTKGFTLIELLVVIAIIGILSSVVLVSLNTARKKGTDARIQEEIAQVRTQLESDYSAGYPDLTGGASHIDTLTSGSAGNTNLTALTGDLATQTGGSFGGNTGVIIYSTVGSGVTPATDYAVYAKTSVGYNCIDNAGNTKANTTGSATNIPAFPASGNLCQ